MREGIEDIVVMGKKSINRFFFQILPFLEYLECLMFGHVNERYGSLKSFLFNFIVDKLVIKIDSGSITLCICKYYSSWASPINSTQAHRTRFATAVHITVS